MAATWAATGRWGPGSGSTCPLPWLRVGANEIVVFDLHQTHAQPIPFEATLNGQSGAVVVQQADTGRASQHWRLTPA